MNWHISCVNSYMKLYIISNRLPVKVTKEDETFVFSRSEGGLATGLDSLQISYEKHWIGWPGICVDNEESKEEITFRLEGINFHPVFLSEIQIHIINRDKTGWCPLETACMELNTVEEMYPVIQNFISRIRAK